MAREFTEGFYMSHGWKQTRKAYVKSVGGLCEDCLRRGIYRPAEIVHHVIPITPENIHDPAVTLAWKNLRAVCRECHAWEHGDRVRYDFNEDGSIAPRAHCDDRGRSTGL